MTRILLGLFLWCALSFVLVIAGAALIDLHRRGMARVHRDGSSWARR